MSQPIPQHGIPHPIESSQLREQPALRGLDPSELATDGRDVGRVACTSLFRDQLTWTPHDLRIAAAVCGHQAGLQLTVLRDVVRSRGPVSDYDRGGDDELVRFAVGLARDAWHYAHYAVELERLDAETFGGRRR